MVPRVWHHLDAAWHCRGRTGSHCHGGLDGVLRLAAVVFRHYRVRARLHGREVGRFLPAHTRGASVRNNWGTHGVQTGDQCRGGNVRHVRVLPGCRTLSTVCLNLDPPTWVGLASCQRGHLGNYGCFAFDAMAGLRPVGGWSFRWDRPDLLRLGLDRTGNWFAQSVSKQGGLPSPRVNGLVASVGRIARIAHMGVLQACLSDLVPQLGAAPFRGSAGSAAAHTRCTEWAIVQKAIAGDTEAQEHLFARHRPRLYRTAVALLRNKEDAEDAVQDGLCKAYTHLRSFQGRSSFSTWLTSIVINSALMSRRRR